MITDTDLISNMKKRFNQWWSTTKRTVTSHLNSLDTVKTTTREVRTISHKHLKQVMVLVGANKNIFKIQSW